ncbi:MAG TPA: GDP-L-fucose synthase [Candidatus Cryosericum sp.]
MLDLTNKRIVVTGGQGFLGTHLVKKLKEHGATKVVPLAHHDYELRDRAQIRRMFDDLHPEVIIHLAAVVGGIGANQLHPGSFFYDNAIMGIQLIEEARLHEIEKFVQVGTICAYPKFTPVPFKEEDLWNGYPEETNAPYGLAKKMLLVQLQAYRQEYGFDGIYLLPVNLYGPGDNNDLVTSHVIPAMIRKFKEAKEQNLPTVTLWGDGSPTREFLYVEDAAEGIVLATERYDKPEPVNLGSGQEISIKDLANLIQRLTGYQGAIIWDTTQPNGQPRRLLDVSRAEREFGFKASSSLSDRLTAMIGAM